MRGMGKKFNSSLKVLKHLKNEKAFVQVITYTFKDNLIQVHVSWIIFTGHPIGSPDTVCPFHFFQFTLILDCALTISVNYYFDLMLQLNTLVIIKI